MTATSTLSPFLTAEQAAKELGTTPLNVRRLAARGILKAAYVGGDALRILPEDLSAYAMAGSPDFEVPALDVNGRFKVEGPYQQAGRLEAEIRAALQKMADEMTEAPSAAEVVVPIAGELAAIVNGAPYQSPSRLVGADKVAPFKTRGEGFAVAFLRENVGSAEALYRTQTAYRAAVDAAWALWSSRSFTAKRTFPAPRVTNSTPPVLVTFKVPFSALAVNEQVVTQLAF